LFILVPNMRSSPMRLLGEKYATFFRALNYFTPLTLKTFAGRELTVVKLKSMQFNPVVMWQDLRRAGAKFPAPNAPNSSSAPTHEQSRGCYRPGWPTGAESVLGAFLLATTLSWSRAKTKLRLPEKLRRDRLDAPFVPASSAVVTLE